MNYLPISSLEATGLVKTACTTLGPFTWDYGETGTSTNFEELGVELGVDAYHMVRTNQKHSANVHVATFDDGGRGIFMPPIAAPKAFEEGNFNIPQDAPYDFSLDSGIDGLITNMPGLALCTTEADCVPVFLLDPKTRSIGMIHSGWRGTAARISERAVNLMNRHFDTNPHDIIAALGPCICKECYEVGAELKEPFKSYFSSADVDNFFTPFGDGKYLLDVPHAVRATLINAGVAPENITMPFECTCHGKHFASYRRDHCTHDRMLTALVLL